MIFLSQYLNRPVRTGDGRKVGTLRDVTFVSEGDFPVVAGLVCAQGRHRRVIPWRAVDRVTLDTFVVREEGSWPELGPAERLLALDVMDSQVVDMDGAHVVRVNDLQLAWQGQILRVVGVDIGPWGLARRLGLAPTLAWLSRSLKWQPPEGLVRWDMVEPVEKQTATVRLRVSSDRLARLHPADLADIVAELGHEQRSQVLEALDDARLADIMEEASPELQSAILDGLDEERAADVLEEMEPDDAADLLSELPEDRARDLMDRMDAEDASEVRDLLAYEDGTVGALMTTSFWEVPASWSVGRALDWVRGEGAADELCSYLYAVDAEGRLAGVLSFRHLVRADVATPLAALFPGQLVTVGAREPAMSALEKLFHYNLLSLPVVQEDGRLLGVVGVLDALSLVHEPEEP
ncbi:MAG: CBS domain-containing protein [Candidatus Sericytochromatia bacterium]|nr:CBS domain-containing protein [Candidatus Sericytochromatia bacterium]